MKSEQSKGGKPCKHGAFRVIDRLIGICGGEMSFLYVALGGAVGALGRFAISLIPTETEFRFIEM